MNKNDLSFTQRITGNDTFEYIEKKNMIVYKAEIEIKVLRHGQLIQNGTWTRDTGIQPLPNRTIQAARRYFRVGTTKVILNIENRYST